MTPLLQGGAASVLPAAPSLSLEDRAVNLLTGMVAIQSYSGEEQQVARFLAGQMAELGLDACVDEAGNAVGIAPFTPINGRPTIDIVMLGHMDTVPGVVPVRREGDLFYGRGSVDAKGPLATFAMAAATTKLPPGVRLIVVGAVEEEAASSKGARFAATQYRPAACVIGEPSHWDGITLGYKGRVLVEYDLTIPSHHSAGPEASVGDCVTAWWERVRAEIEVLNEGRSSPFEVVQSTLLSIRTDSDGRYDTARAQAGFRLPLGVDPKTIVRICEDRAALGCEFAPVIRSGGHEVAYRSDRNTALVRALTAAIREHGGQPHPRVKTGTSDLNVLGPVWNCPIVAYGPGDSRLDHTPNEHIAISEYLRAIAVLRTAIERLAAELSAS